MRGANEDAGIACPAAARLTLAQSLWRREMAGVAGTRGTFSGSRLRIVAWGAAATLLLVPLVAMQLTDDVAWTAGDFVAAGIFLFTPIVVYEIVVRKTPFA